MRWRSATSLTGCAAAGLSCSPGRGTSVSCSSAERYELQQLLAQRGFDRRPDGQLGGMTPRTALREGFQASIGQVPDGFASATMLERLRGAVRRSRRRRADKAGAGFTSTPLPQYYTQ